MALYQITVQVNESDHLRTTVFLDGQMYRIDFYTNKWDNAWYFDLYDNQNTPLVLGCGLVAGIDLLYPYRSKPVPPGQLFVWSQGDTISGGNGSVGVTTLIDPTLDAFSKSVATLYYNSVT